jgi:hypothetical protein
MFENKFKECFQTVLSNSASGLLTKYWYMKGLSLLSIQLALISVLIFLIEGLICVIIKTFS